MTRAGIVARADILKFLKLVIIKIVTGYGKNKPAYTKCVMCIIGELSIRIGVILKFYKTKFAARF